MLQQSDVHLVFKLVPFYYSPHRIILLCGYLSRLVKVYLSLLLGELCDLVKDKFCFDLDGGGVFALCF